MNAKIFVCPHCGASVDVGAKFCPNCGTSLPLNPTDAKPSVSEQIPTDVLTVILILAALGFGISGPCFVGFGAFGFDNRDIGFPPSAKMFLLGLFLSAIAGLCLYAIFLLNRRRNL